MRVFLMPAASDQETLFKQSQWLVDVCKTTGFRYSSRLQVALWDRCVGK